MSCPINTLLDQGKAFESLSEQDQIIALTELLSTINGSQPTPAKEFQALSERGQWLAIAILIGEVANQSAGGSPTDTNPNTLLANGADFQGASTKNGMTGIVQQACNA